MAYVSIPKDLTRVKTKFILGLTKRQAVCFGAAAVTGLHGQVIRISQNSTDFGGLFRSIKVFRRWRGLFTEYYPLDIRSFLPFFIQHLERYVALEKKHSIATQECKDYKIATAQETIDILKRLLADDYVSVHREEIEQKWGKFPYKKTTYSDGSIGYEHLTPSRYDDDMHAAYEKAIAEEQSDLKRLGEIVEKNMLDWWD